jgi:hypothetical protein
MFHVQTPCSQNWHDLNELLLIWAPEAQRLIERSVHIRGRKNSIPPHKQLILLTLFGCPAGPQTEAAIQ